MFLDATLSLTFSINVLIGRVEAASTTLVRLLFVEIWIPTKISFHDTGISNFVRRNEQLSLYLALLFFPLDRLPSHFSQLPPQAFAFVGFSFKTRYIWIGEFIYLRVYLSIAELEVRSTTLDIGFFPLKFGFSRRDHFTVRSFPTSYNEMKNSLSFWLSFSSPDRLPSTFSKLPFSIVASVVFAFQTRCCIVFTLTNLLIYIFTSQRVQAASTMFWPGFLLFKFGSPFYRMRLFNFLWGNAELSFPLALLFFSRSFTVPF